MGPFSHFVKKKMDKLENSTLPISSSTSYLVFRLNEQLYAVETLSVQEIFMLPELVPRAGPFPSLAGLVNYRGRIVPVVNLEIRLGFRPSRYRLGHKVLLLNRGLLQVGLIVHDVLDVFDIHSSLISIPTLSAFTLEKPGEGIVSGETLLGEDMVVILDPQKIAEPAGPEKPIVEGGNGKSGMVPKGDSDRIGIFFPEATEEEREVLRQRAQALREYPKVEDPAGVQPHAVFELGGETYGTELHVVSEFTESLDVTPIPNCPDHIVGYMNLRGEVLTVIDIRGVLNPDLSGPSMGTLVMVIRLKELTVGIIVDKVLDVIYPRSTDLVPTPNVVPAEKMEFLKCAAFYGGRMIGIPDFEKILALENLAVDEEI